MGLCWIRLPSQYVLDEVLARLVTTSDEWPTRDIKEPHVFRDLLPPVEFCRVDITVDLHMAFRWAHILSKSHDVNVDLAQFYSGSAQGSSTNGREYL